MTRHLEFPLADGLLDQIDYEKTGRRRITALHVHSPIDGTRTEIRIRYPAEEQPWESATDRNPVVILRDEQAPEVSVVRIA
jgi:hypothetical protein